LYTGYQFFAVNCNRLSVGQKQNTLSSKTFWAALICDISSMAI